LVLNNNDLLDEEDCRGQGCKLEVYQHHRDYFVRIPHCLYHFQGDVGQHPERGEADYGYNDVEPESELLVIGQVTVGIVLVTARVVEHVAN